MLDLWRALWRGDRASSDTAMLGEHRVAQSRVLLTAVPTVLGLLVLVADPGNASYRGAVPVNLFCLAAAMLFLYWTRTGVRPLWLAYTTTIWDVSLVSALHAVELWQGLASTAVNGRVTFSGYFLAMVGTCVRWDRRLPLVVGGLAALQYALIAWWAARVWQATPATDVAAYGLYDAGVQVERVVTLVLFAFICRAIVGWAIDLRHSAVHDVLTGLLNRRTFEERLRDELLTAGRTGLPLSVAMLDVDHFKQVNDRHGHAAGDLALQAVAQSVRQAVRRTDLVARWGGEEFALVLPVTALPEATAKVEAIRIALAGLAIPVGRGVDVRLTVSGGVACAPADGTSIDALIGAADARLFEAKGRGRNQVIAGAA